MLSSTSMGAVVMSTLVLKATSRRAGVHHLEQVSVVGG